MNFYGDPGAIPDPEWNGGEKLWISYKNYFLMFPVVFCVFQILLYKIMRNLEKYIKTDEFIANSCIFDFFYVLTGFYGL